MCLAQRYAFGKNKDYVGEWTTVQVAQEQNGNKWFEWCMFWSGRENKHFFSKKTHVGGFALTLHCFKASRNLDF